MDHSKWNKINTFIFDVDGVFTDGSIQISESGQFLRTMNVKDGMSLKVAVKRGYTVAVITKVNSKAVKKRLLELGAQYVYDEVKDKNIPFQELVTKYNIDPLKSLYMGDDLADVVLMDQVLLACAPYDAVPEVINSAEYISPKKGGHGAVRDVIEKVLRSNGHWS